MLWTRCTFSAKPRASLRLRAWRATTASSICQRSGGVGAQRLHRGQDGAAVDMNRLERNALHALGQIFHAAEQALVDLLRAELQQGLRILAQVEADDAVAVDRMTRHRQHGGDAPQLRRIACGDVQQRIALIEQLRDPALGAQRQRIVEQARLPRLDQPCQRDGGAHVRQGVMGAGVLDTVGGGQLLETEGGGPVLTPGPLDALRPQGVGQTHHVDQVPAGVAVLPLAGVGIEEVAVQEVAGDFVVEADAVVADAAGAGPRQLRWIASAKSASDTALAPGPLGRDPGDQAGIRLGQQVVRRAAVEHQRLTDVIELLVGAQAGELGRADPGAGRRPRSRSRASRRFCSRARANSEKSRPVIRGGFLRAQTFSLIRAALPVRPRR